MADISKAEWALMGVLWARKRGTATELQTNLAPTRGWAYSTVKTMLDRLVEKGYVAARRVGHVYEYSPKVRQRTVAVRMLDDLAEGLGSVSPFVQRWISQRRLTPEEAAELRRLLDAYPPPEGQGRSDAGEDGHEDEPEDDTPTR